MPMTPNRIAAGLAALVFAVVGAWGLTASLDPALDPIGGALLASTLGTNVVLAAVHLVLAILLALGGIRGESLARPLNVGVGAFLLVLGLVGLFVAGTPANVFALNGAANVLHFAASSALLATGLGAPRLDRVGPQG
jgi:hypothetical protein